MPSLEECLQVGVFECSQIVCFICDAVGGSASRCWLGDAPVCVVCFAVAGLVDSLIYHSARAIQKKIELGKAS